MHHTDVDWEAVERSPEFEELMRRRNRFIMPATIFFLAWFIIFILLAGYAEDFMGESIYQGLTVGYVLALSQFVMVWTLSWLYLRKATNEFDPLQDLALEAAREFTSDPVDRDARGRPTGAPADAPVAGPAAPAAVAPAPPAPPAPAGPGGAS